MSRSRLDREIAADVDDIFLGLGVVSRDLVVVVTTGVEVFVALNPIVFLDRRVRLHRSRVLRSEMRLVEASDDGWGNATTTDRRSDRCKGVVARGVVRRAETREEEKTFVVEHFGVALVATTFLAIVLGFLVRLSNDGVRGSLDERVVRMRLLMELRRSGI